MIKNFIFDLDGVFLTNNHYDLLRGIVDEKDFAYYDNMVFRSQFWKLADIGEIDATQLTKLLQNGKTEKDKQSIEKIMENWYKNKKIDNELLKIVKLLKKKGYKIYVLSNLHKQLENYLESKDFFKNFDGRVISSDVHALKPDTKIFEILTRKYTLTHDECLFIDDKKENIQSANNIGINGYLYTDLQSFKRFLSGKNESANQKNNKLLLQIQ